MIKFGFEINYWISKFGVDFHRALDEIAIAGWEGVELSTNFLNYYLDNIKELKVLLNLHNLKMTSFFSFLNLVDKDYFKTEMRIIEKKINLIKELGSDVLVIDGGKKNPKGNTENDYKFAIENIQIICDAADLNNLKPTWHQHWGTMFDSKETFEYLMER